MNSCFSSFAAPPLWRCGSCAWTRPHLPFLGLRRQTPGHISLSKTIKENRSVFRKVTLKKLHFEKTLQKFWYEKNIIEMLAKLIPVWQSLKEKAYFYSFKFHPKIVFMSFSIKPSHTNIHVRHLIISSASIASCLIFFWINFTSTNLDTIFQKLASKPSNDLCW